MEAILLRQDELITSINSILTNFKKDSEIRKTSEYLSKRIESLDNLWAEFESNDNRLCTFDDKTQGYFTEDIFLNTRQTYQSVRAMLTTHKNAPASVSIQDAKNETDPKLAELKNQQKTNFRALQRAVKGLQIDKLDDKWELEDELRNLQMRWNNVDSLHWQIDNILMGTDKSYEQEYSEYETLYKLVKRDLNKKLSMAAHLHESTPKLDIPIFSGNYTQWPTFIDLYKSGIHDNPLLSKAQKMQHLKGKLRGEAERLIQHLNVSCDNYDTAWEILEHRYNNQHILFTKQIEIFLNQPVIQKQSSFEIKRMYDTTMESIHAIHNLGVDTTSWDPLLVHLLSKKLDPVTYSDYKEARKSPRSLPVLEEFMTFLETKFTALEPIQRVSKHPSGSKQGAQIKNLQPNYQAAGAGKSTGYTKNFYAKSFHCIVCNLDHALYKCKKFESMPADVKLKTVSQHGICKNCLYVHENNICKSTKRCKNCSNQHNTLLHEAFINLPNTSNPTKATATFGQQQSRQQNVNYIRGNDDEVLLPTVKVRVLSRDGTFLTFKALLDQGSQITLISENAAQRLGLSRRYLNASISGVGTLSDKCKGEVQLTCKSIYDEYSFNTEALVMPQLIRNLPSNSFDTNNYQHIQHIPLADPDYNISQPIDILFDAQVYSEIILNGLIKGSSQQPIAQQTKIGWILSGPVTISYKCHVIINNIEDISKFWEIEEIPTERHFTEQELYCEQLYTATTKRMPDGRYEVRMPMKEGFQDKLGTSKPQAVAQFKQLERRFDNNQEYFKSYHKFINEYIELGHMKKCITKRNPECYLPHHGVFKQDSVTTKLRVVYNASGKTSSGYSLNDLMECGPKLQQDLLGLLIKWRLYRFVYTADCEKMYRMILVAEDQQHLQKIVWRDSPQDNMTEYVLTTVTYGTKSAPFLAMRTMKQLSIDEAENYPLAANILDNDFFVDDLLTGSNTEKYALEIRNQLIKIMSRGGFNLRKWSSNAPQLLDGLAEEQLNLSTLHFKDTNDTTKTLGLKWNPKCDEFSFDNKCKQNDCSKNQYTKRVLLSDISKLFDPLGWLSPITIKAKLIFQSVWSAGINWDDIVPTEIQERWVNLKADLPNIDKICIPRWVGNSQKEVELHGICDASEKAYACVVYVKSLNSQGENTVQLLAAKTKLAPIKINQTLPRLELCGALLMTTLIKKIIDIMTRLDIRVRVYGWTDSMVVLGWLRSDPTRWKVFVSNRVQQIISTIPAVNWRHIRSTDNSADCATRGLTPSQLIEHSLWWEGPSWLKNYSTDSSTQEIEIPEIEVKISKQTCIIQKYFFILEDIINKRSSMTQAVRIACWVSRFITNAWIKVTRRRPDICSKQSSTFHTNIMKDRSVAISTYYLTSVEIERAYNMIISMTQLQSFKIDIEHLKQNKKLDSRSGILKLKPYLDNEGILRIGGRLEHSILPLAAKHPIIIPKESRLTDLLVDQAHKTTLHGGPRLTLAYLRQKYWIIDGYRTVKKYIRRCVKCSRFSHPKQNQLMADLPASRVIPSRPFTHTGVDFTGQVEVKANKGRGIKTTKGYVSVFVCLTTKAIHLELVSDLSSAMFLAAFKRFCARRGTPKHMYSDSGTNFIGASRILKKEYIEALKSINTDFLNQIGDMRITWHFNAPAWPSAGGLWEAAVKSMKFHLKRVIGDQKLTFEEFTTLLTQIEGCLNSRPLYAMTENPDDEYLTPGHFLIGGPILSSPISDDDSKSLTTRWQMTEKMHRDFWRKWSSEYLQTLQVRSKWNHPIENLQLSDIVLVKEDNMPPSKWALGKVIELHPGKDGYVRVVTLKTQSGTLKRPVSKLSPLPINNQAPNQEQPTNDMQKDPPDSQDKQPPKRNRRKPNFLVSAILLLCCCISPSVQQFCNITSLQNGNALYFDKIADIGIIQDQWKMVIYYNMTTYWQSMVQIQDYIEHIQVSCKSEPLLTFIASQLKHEIDELQHYNSLLVNDKITRRKRGLINGVGYVANSLFGILDDRFAKRYEQDIETIKIREEHLFKLYKNQTSILEAEDNILKRNEDVMNQNFHTINRHLNVMQTQFNHVKQQYDSNIKEFYVMSTLVSADVIISNLRRVQDILIDTVTDIYHGRINVHFLSPNQIQQQLNIISGHIHGDLKIPVQNIRELYGLLHIQARVTSRYLIMEVQIPLIHIDQFELDRIIVIPQKQGEKTVFSFPQFSYLAINVKKDSIIPMNEGDIRSCTKYAEKQMLCQSYYPIYNMKMGSSICDMRLSVNENNTYCHLEVRECTDKWVKLHTQDSWLFSCCNSCKVRIICPYGVVTKDLRGNGIIKLEQECELKSDIFTIHSHHGYINKVFMQKYADMEVPTISVLNNVMNTSVPNIILTDNHTEIFQDIHKRLTQLNLEKLEDMPEHSTTHYIAIYTALVIIMVVIIVYFLLKWRKHCQKGNTLQQNMPSVHVTMSPSECSASRAAVVSTSSSVDKVISSVVSDDNISETFNDSRPSIRKSLSESVLSAKDVTHTHPPLTRRTVNFSSTVNS